MDSLQIITQNDSLVVDSRLIAPMLDIEHKNLLANIRKYLTQIEQFGQVLFKTATVQNVVGAVNEVSFCYLNEDQAIFVMTLSRNTQKVVECKVKLVKAFKEARARLNNIDIFEETPKPLPPKTRDVIEYVEASEKILNFPDSRLQRLLKARLEHELSLQEVNQKMLTSSQSDNYTTVTVLAHSLGYSSQQIGNGVKLGRYVKQYIAPAFKDYQGQYEVWHYKVTDRLKNVIHDYFRNRR